MKRFAPIATLFVLASSLLTSCGIVEGIFKAGMWWGIIVVVAIIALIIWLFTKLTGGRKRE